MSTVQQDLDQINITGAALITQFSLCAIVVLASYLLYRAEDYPRQDRQREWTGLPWITVALLLITIGVLLFSQEFAAIWGPLFRADAVRLIPAEAALLTMFGANIICIWILVWVSGGTANSPFTSLYFLIPPLALFLQEPMFRVIGYTLLVGVAFTVTYMYSPPLIRKESREPIEIPRLPGWIVAVSSLALATFIGLLTRP